VIVCVCRFVNDGAIRVARDAGAITVEAIGAATGAGTCCGSCRPTIARILAEGARAGGCEGCPSRAEAVPARIAADKVETP
jgi:bacterioferritin-associated ferredoxin